MLVAAPLSITAEIGSLPTYNSHFAAVVWSDSEGVYLST
jgi:hypothetical protein